MRIKKAQSAMEFMILIGFVMVAFAIFFLVISENLKERTNEQIYSQVKEVALTIQNEINLAHGSIDGYSRNFTLPEEISGKSYVASIDDDLIYVGTNDGEYKIYLPVKNITGYVTNAYENQITKINGQVRINV